MIEDICYIVVFAVGELFQQSLLIFSHILRAEGNTVVYLTVTFKQIFFIKKSGKIDYLK